MLTHETGLANYNSSTPEDGAKEMPERMHEKEPSFDLRFSQKDRATFASLVGKVGLNGAITTLRPMIALQERRGKTFSEEEYDMAEQLANTIENSGLEIEADNVQFRWVSATDNLTIEQLRESAYTTGGAEPEAPWIHTGSTVVEDFMTQYSSNTSSGVLFVYDGAKLTSPSEEEFREQARIGGKLTRVYASKAKPGYELKDTVIGTISFDPPDVPEK